MDEPVKMVISRGKVTFTRNTDTRCSSWVLLAGDDPSRILDIVADMLRELRPEQHTVSHYASSQLVMPVSEERPPAYDGVAFQPPKQTTLRGNIDLGSVEPAPR